MFEKYKIYIDFKKLEDFIRIIDNNFDGVLSYKEFKLCSTNLKANEGNF